MNRTNSFRSGLNLTRKMRVRLVHSVFLIWVKKINPFRINASSWASSTFKKKENIIKFSMFNKLKNFNKLKLSKNLGKLNDKLII